MRERETENRQQTGKEKRMKKEIKIEAGKLKWWRWKWPGNALRQQRTVRTVWGDAMFSLAILSLNRQ